MLLDRHDSIDLATFLAEYWQKKPLLIKNALPGFTDFISPEELAGLSLDEDVESRLAFNNAGNWELKHGPFSERDFTFLPESHWTLLVQSVDHWIPEVKSLMQKVAFIPGWRLDDIMVSYAAKDGGVGPHFDYYDVFLIQGQGSRLWQIGKNCNSETPLDTSSGLKILSNFSPEQELELNTGDVLYVPAGMSHCGTAINAGISYSIGFRAPDVAELLSAYSHLAGNSLPQDMRYRDPGLDQEASPGEITSASLHQVKALMQHAFDDQELLLQCFGRLMTEPRLPDLLQAPETPLTPQEMVVTLQKGKLFQLHPAARLACYHQGDNLLLFINGESLLIKNTTGKIYALNDELQSSTGRKLDLRPFQHNEACLKLLTLLYNQGSLVLVEETAVIDEE